MRALFFGCAFVCSAFLHAASSAQLEQGHGGQQTGRNRCLLNAITQNSIADVMCALSDGADQNFVDPETSKPLLCLAIQAGGAQARQCNIEQLLHRGARVQVADKDGTTALHWAARVGNARTVRWLLELGASSSTLDLQGKSPLAVARENGHAHVVEVLTRWPEFEKSVTARLRTLLAAKFTRCGAKSHLQALPPKFFNRLCWYANVPTNAAQVRRRAARACKHFYIRLLSEAVNENDPIKLARAISCGAEKWRGADNDILRYVITHRRCALLKQLCDPTQSLWKPQHVTGILLALLRENLPDYAAIVQEVHAACPQALDPQCHMNAAGTDFFCDNACVADLLLLAAQRGNLALVNMICAYQMPRNMVDFVLSHGPSLHPKALALLLNKRATSAVAEAQRSNNDGNGVLGRLLCAAVDARDHETALKLLQNGANPDAQMTSDSYVLSRAWQHRDYAMMELLLCHGAWPRGVPDQNTISVLSQSQTNKDEVATDMLVAHGAGKIGEFKKQPIERTCKHGSSGFYGAMEVLVPCTGAPCFHRHCLAGCSAFRAVASLSVNQLHWLFGSGSAQKMGKRSGCAANLRDNPAELTKGCAVDQVVSTKAPAPKQNLLSELYDYTVRPVTNTLFAAGKRLLSGLGALWGR